MTAVIPSKARNLSGASIEVKEIIRLPVNSDTIGKHYRGHSDYKRVTSIFYGVFYGEWIGVEKPSSERPKGIPALSKENC